MDPSDRSRDPQPSGDGTGSPDLQAHIPTVFRVSARIHLPQRATRFKWNANPTREARQNQGQIGSVGIQCGHQRRLRMDAPTPCGRDLGWLWEFPSQEQSLESELPAVPPAEANLTRPPSEAAACGVNPSSTSYRTAGFDAASSSGTSTGHPTSKTAYGCLGQRPSPRPVPAQSTGVGSVLKNPARHWAIHSTAFHTFEGWQELIKQSL